MSRSSIPHQQAYGKHARSPSLSASTSSSQSQSPLLESDHTLSLLAMTPPSSSFRVSSPLFQGDLVPLIDKNAMEEGHVLPHQPFTLPRLERDASTGTRRQPGLKNLPQWLRGTFRDRFIRHIIERVCLSNLPWNNPTLSFLQQELNHVYPTHRIRLHSDDAAVIPVRFVCSSTASIASSHNVSRPFGTSVSFGTKLETKVLPRSSNTYLPSTTNEC